MAFKSKYTGSQIENLLDSVNNGEIGGATLTENDIAGMGFTKNTGTITAIQANGTTVASSGTANIPAATTGAYGVTKLTTSTSSTSTSLAATASAVKSAYDLANGKQDKLVSGTNIKTINGQSLLGNGNITIEGGTGGSSSSNGEDIRYFANFTVENFMRCAEYGTTTTSDTTDLINAAKNNKLICVPYGESDKGFHIASYKFQETESEEYDGTEYYFIIEIENEGVRGFSYLTWNGSMWVLRGGHVEFDSTVPEEGIEVDEDGRAHAEIYDKGVYIVTDYVTELNVFPQVELIHGTTIRFTTGDFCTLDIGGNVKWAEGTFPVIEPYTTYEMSLTHDFMDYSILLILTPFKYSE